jgi:DNA-binding CsgD family transcriptional regulator
LPPRSPLLEALGWGLPSVRSTSEKGSPPASKRGRWSIAELARLRELYGLRDDAVIARELKRPVTSIARMARSLFPEEVKSGPWTANEVQTLKRYLGATTPEVIARILGRSVETVQSQIFDLGRIHGKSSWSRSEVSDFKRIYGTRTDEDLSRIFGREVREIRRVAQEHGLSKDKAFLRKIHGEPATRMPRWRAEELETLRENYATLSNLEMARRLGRSVKSVVSKAHHLGLRKSTDRLREMGRENVSARYSPN